MHSVEALCSSRPRNTGIKLGGILWEKGGFEPERRALEAPHSKGNVTLLVSVLCRMMLEIVAEQRQGVLQHAYNYKTGFSCVAVLPR